LTLRSTEPAIEAVDITKKFGDFVALDHLSFRVPAGKVFGFLGPNGAGKSTTIRILGGLSRLDGGSASIAGVPAKLNSAELRSRIGYLPDHPAFYSWMSGIESMVFFGELFHLDRKEARRRGEELLEVTGLRDAAKRKVGGYSSGMRQRLGLAQALINRPQVLIIDEPAAALDPMGRVEVLDLLDQLTQDDTTVFMSTHLLDDVERVCEEVAIIDHGKLVVQAKVEELRDRYAHPVIEVDFDAPQESFAEQAGRMPGVAEVRDLTGVNRRFRVLLAESGDGRDRVFATLHGLGSSVRRFEVVRPSLEDVFVKLVGQRGGTEE